MKTKSNKTPKAQPVKQFRSRSVKAAIWKNVTDKGTFFNLTLERLFKAGEKWRSSSTFGIGDTSDMEMVIMEAREWVADQFQPAPAKA